MKIKEFYQALVTVNYAAKNINEGRLKLGISQMTKADFVLPMFSHTLRHPANFVKVIQVFSAPLDKYDSITDEGNSEFFVIILTSSSADIGKS